MHHFFLDPAQINSDQVRFPSDISHQIVNVLRLKDDDVVAVLDNSGSIYKVSLSIDRDSPRVTGKILTTDSADAEPETGLSLYFGLTHREKVEWILQKGTEIGVSAFLPFVSARTIVKKTTLSRNKFDRWVRIIREAAEQSHRGRLPVLNPPKPLAACFAESKEQHDLRLIAYEEAQAQGDSLRDLIRKNQFEKVALFIGPEGGFAKEEILLAEKEGCAIISLGARILRMETAAVVLPALVLYELGEL